LKITAIKAQVKNENRVSIFLDGKYSFSLTLDQLLQEKLKKNDELDENDVKQLKKLSDEGKLKVRTLEWLMNRPHSTRELRDYLYKKQADAELIASWVEEFTDKKYLSDETFARWFAENRQRKNKSTREISSELAAKGIPPAIRSVVLRELEQSDDESLKKLINKVGSRSRYQDKQKLISYLISKGFSYSAVKDALAEKEE
jgi:regulatory protein